MQWLRSVAQWRVSDALQLRNTLYAYDALRDYRNVETYAFNATNTAVARSGVLLQRHDHEVIGNRLEANYQGTLAGRRSESSSTAGAVLGSVPSVQLPPSRWFRSSRA